MYNISSICDTSITRYNDIEYKSEVITIRYTQIQEDSVTFGILSPVKKNNKHFILIVNDFYKSYYDIVPLWSYFNKAGYSIIEVQYRGQSLTAMEHYPKTYGIKEVDDFLCIVKYLKETYGADTKISVYANSYGGLIALNAINRSDDIYKVCFEALLFDLNKVEQKFNEGGSTVRMFLGDFTLLDYPNISPKIQLPLLKSELPSMFFWGENDEAFPTEDRQIVQELLKDKNATIKIVPKVGHSFRFGYPLTQQEVDLHNMSIVRFLTE
ncbi:MAG: prolyl oligopeptidase family serine peptidase [Candidatus Kapabacteria bacterium]|nr:prolyl oligopeptidase family serine peptidase [Candidatus Kapabacteria bacterium]